jgi:hypothetical protein
MHEACLVRDFGLNVGTISHSSYHHGQSSRNARLILKASCQLNIL